MRILKTDLQACLSQTAEICKVYKSMYLGSGATVRFLDNLVHLVATHEQKQVQILRFEMAAADEQVKGGYVAFDDRYDVYLLGDLNFCWERFVLCKELFHVILDKSEYRNMRIGELVEEFTSAFPADDIRPGPAVTNELVAEICAMEFLFPYADRISLASRPHDSSEIAEQYKVPKVFVERYLSDAYCKNLKEFCAEPETV